ncbi:MAG: dockerin type I domain-containing protein, partial [Planctomycetota bacterium]
GGFGALQYEQVMEQYRQFNTDPDHPMFVMLHHDGDNFGGGSEAYYHGNFNNMVNWASNNPNYDVTTVQDYLDRFPVDPNEVVHIESGSWAGADNGDPEFKKWLGDPDPNTGWSPDRNSWAVLTAAKNRVFTADDIAPATNLDNIINGVGTSTERAWHTLLQAEASDHWYWDGTEVWDSNVTLGSNQAVSHADTVINSYGGVESTAPTVFLPQREAYNPGGDEFGSTQPSDFEVWTYAYDVSGLQSVQLKYRVDGDGTNPLDSIQNETYAGGDEVGDWIAIDMLSSDIAPPPGILTPTYRALRYGAMIEGIEDSLVDYYVEAIDLNGNIEQTDIQHVYVGSSVITPGVDRVMLTPETPTAGESVSITYNPAGGPLADAASVYAHVGFNDWEIVNPTDSPLTWNATSELWELTLPVSNAAEQLDLVFNNGANVWDNNDGSDWHFAVVGGDPGEPGIDFVMDGQLDQVAELLAGDESRGLWVKVDGDQLYVATNDAGEGADIFLYIAAEPGELTDANWGKSGQVAAWDAFLADENDNDYEGWFEAISGEAATGANGGVLEGVIDLAAQFGGELPDEIYLAVGAFDSADGGQLLYTLQLPASVDANGNLDASEFVRLLLATVAGDYNGDGLVDAQDYLAWKNSYGSESNLAADGNGDGKVDLADYTIWRDAYVAAVSAGLTAGVPEPMAVVLVASLLPVWVRGRRRV